MLKLSASDEEEEVGAIAMAMASVASCSRAIGVFSSSSPSPLKQRKASVTANLPAPLPNVSLDRHTRQRDFQPLRRHCARQLTRREARNRGLAFASLRDARELVQSGVVRPIPAAEVSALLSEGGYALLDIRPIWEREKASVTGSYHVPLFVEDDGTGALTFLKRGIHQGQGGWWTGLKLTTRNEQFVEQVQAAVPPGQKLLVACGEGLRSLLALEELNDAGFEQLAWLAGGFNTVRDTDSLDVEGSTKLCFASVGGASEYFLKFIIFLRGLAKLVKGKESLDST